MEKEKNLSAEGLFSSPLPFSSFENNPLKTMKDINDNEIMTNSIKENSCKKDSFSLSK